MNDTLAPATDMGLVALRVADLDAMAAYYRDGVGLDQLETGVDSVLLGRGTRASIRLQHDAELKHAPSGAAGLFHTAVLFDSPAALAGSVYGVASKYPTSFTGSSDHLVSNAFYFDDPEGNGVELYWDRPRDEWRWNGSSVEMATIYLDPNAFLREHLTGTPTLGETSVGHVHLKVGDIASAKAFYVDIIGFDITARFGEQALFVSAGGYHHHVGMNTWQSQGAGPRTPALGLGQVTIRVPDVDALGALRERLVANGVAVRDDGHALDFEDPWNNAVHATLS
jgi:catechol 2,3-dioxygenase